MQHACRLVGWQCSTIYLTVVMTVLDDAPGVCAVGNDGTYRTWAMNGDVQQCVQITPDVAFTSARCPTRDAASRGVTTVAGNGPVIDIIAGAGRGCFLACLRWLCVCVCVCVCVRLEPAQVGAAFLLVCFGFVC